jgi:transposase
MQRRENDARRMKKITILLMLDGGFTAEQIAFSFGIDDSTVYRCIESFENATVLGDYLQDGYLPYEGKLTEAQQRDLAEELRSRLYRTAKEVVQLVKERFRVSYTPSGIRPLLQRMGFVYKKTRLVGTKADPVEQEAFLKQFDQLVASCSEADEIYFSDAVHPQHNTRSCSGWIASGEDFEVESNTGRDRVNINGALNAFDVTDVVVRTDESINAQSTIELYKQLEHRNRTGTIYVICDNARYYRSRLVQQWLATSRVVQVFLPSYSPNLNLIERLWKFVRKNVIDAVFYPTKEMFRESVMGFFKELKKYKSELESLLTLNFHIAQVSQTT